MMHRTRAEYDNHYLTDVFKIRKGDNPISPLLLRYKTGKGDNFILDMHIIWLSLLFNSKWGICQLYNGENRLHCDNMTIMSS
jgi:hypothetical protein